MTIRALDPIELGLGEANIELSRLQQAQAQWQLGGRNTGLGHVFKQFRRAKARMEDSPLIDVKQANELAPDLPEPITEPIKLSVLQDLIAENELQTTLRKRIAAGPDDWVSAGQGFLMNMGVHMMDPLEFMAGGFASMGVGALGKAMMAGRFTKSASAIKMGEALAHGDKVTYARLATEGLLGEAAIEPFLIAGTLDDHQDVDIMNSFISVAGGSLGFAALMRGVAEVPTLLSKFGENAAGAYHRVSTGQLMYGKKVRADKVTKQVVEEAHNAGPSEKIPDTNITSKSGERTIDVNHKSQNITPRSQIEGPSFALQRARDTRWYIPHRLAGGIGTDERSILNAINPGKYLGGKGITLTDNPMTANGYASHSMLKSKGNIYEVAPFPDSKLVNIQHIDYETIPPKSTARQLASAQLTKLGLNKTEVQKVLKNNPTYLEAMDRLIALKNQGKLKGVKDIGELQDWFIENVTRGDAVAYRNTKTAGVDHKPQNLLYIKPSTIERLQKKGKSVFKTLDEYEPNSDFNKRPSKAELTEFAEDYANPKTDRYYDSDAATELESVGLNPMDDPAVAELNEITQSHRDTLKAMDEAGELDAADRALLEELDEMTAAHEQELEIAKDGFNCQLGL